MKTRFVAYNRLGARRGVLTHILQAEVVPSKNELPTLTLTYPRSQPTHKWLLNSPEVAFEYFQNNEWVEPKNARFKLVSQDFDYLEEVETRNYSFIGIGEGTRGIYVYGPNGKSRNDEGKVQFEDATPGEMLAHVWDYAVKRGWKGFTRSFTPTRDSAPVGDGQAWKNRLNLSFADDTSLESMLMYFSRLGMIDFEWEGRTLHVYNADASMQRDLSTGTNPMRFNLSGGRASVDSAPESNDHENLATHVVVTGEEGLRWVFPTGVILPEGRREVFLSYSGVDDEGTAQILAAPTIVKYSNSLKNTTRQFQIGPSTTAFPYIDYRVGDWVLVEKDDGNWERVQIFQLALLINQNGVQGYVSLGDKIDSLLEKLNEAVQRVQGGSVNEGTEPPADSVLKPSPPSGVVATARTVYTSKGESRAVIGVNFAHNGMDVYGDPIAIDSYRVMCRKKGKDGVTWGWDQILTIAAPAMSGTYSYLDITDHTGALLTYEIRVIAVSNKGKLSEPSVHANLDMKYDNVPPQKPAKPTVKVALAVFEISTNHRTTTGALQDVDYAHTVVEMGTTVTGPWVERSTIVPPLKTAYIGGEGYNTRWFRLVAVDWEGNRSEPSEVVSSTAKPMVDADLIIAEIDAGKTRIINAGKIVMESGTELNKRLADADKAISDTNTALTGPGGLTERLAGAETKLKDVGKLMLSDGATLNEKLSDAADAIEDAEAEILKVVNRVGPIETGLNTLTKTTIPNLTKSIDGKTTINRQTTVAANPANYSLGDRWEQWDKLTTGGKLLKTWRHNGTAWIEEILAASYLPLVDIGAGTFGSLEGGRLTANSVSTQSLLVGSFSNLIENGSFDHFTSDGHPASWAGIPTGWSIDPTGGRNGTAALRAKGITERTFGPTTAINVPIEHGDSYRVSGWVKTNATTAATRGEICLYYYRADGSFFGNQNFNIDGATSEWKQFSGIITPNNTEPAYFRVRVNATLTHVSQEYYFDDIAVVKASNGSLVVNGSITGDHVDAETVGAKVGKFVTLGVDQLTVTGNADLKEAVVDKLFANIFSVHKLMAGQVMVGMPNNVLADIGHNEPQMLAARNASSTMVVGLSSTNDYMLTPHATSNTYFRPLGVPQNTTSYKDWVAVKPGEVWRFGLTVVSMRAEGWIKFVGRTLDGQEYANPAGSTIVNGGHGSYVYEAEIPEGCYWITPEFMLPPGTANTWIDCGSMFMHQVIDSALIVEGGVLAKHITASEEMSAKVGQFLKLNVVDLVTSGNAKINEAVVTKLFTETFATRKLTANQVYIGEGGNLFPADMNDEAWQRLHSISFAATGGKTGGTSMLIPGGGTQMGTYFGIADVSERERMPKLVAGQKYRVRANILSTGTIPKNGAAVYLRLYGPTKTTYVWVPGSAVTNAAAVAANAWGEVEGIFEVPEDSVNLYLGVGLYSQAIHTGNLRWSDLIVQEAITPELIVDGAITTKKLTITEEMVAELFKVKKVEAVEIDFNSLFGDTGFIGSLRTTVLTTNSITSTMIESDAINAKHTLTGPLIRSAASGARTEMTNQGIRVVNSSNVELVRLGYGISTGMSIRNPSSSEMTPISSMVFGVEYLNGNTNHIFSPSAGQGSWWPVKWALSSGNNWWFNPTTDKAIIHWTAQVGIYPSSYPSGGMPLPSDVHFALALHVRATDAGNPPPPSSYNPYAPAAKGRVKTYTESTSAVAFGTSVSGMIVVDSLRVGTPYGLEIHLSGPDGFNLFQSGDTRVIVQNIQAIIIPR